MTEDSKRHLADPVNLPPNFPTHRHSPDFWEALGRTVATFGFLEETLARAIFALTGMRQVPEDRVEEAFAAWLKLLERTVSDQLGGLIRTFEKALRDYPSASVYDFEVLLSRLREASVLRNVICHGSWRSPDANGRSLPFFVDKKGRAFDRPIDLAFLRHLQQGTAELTCEVKNAITLRGWQFPGAAGPGRPVYRRPRGNSDAI